MCTTSDNTIATNSFEKESDDYALAVISHVQHVTGKGDRSGYELDWDYYIGRDVNLRYEGTLASEDLVLFATERRWIGSGRNNSITISISAGDIGASKDGDNKVRIYTRISDLGDGYTGVADDCVHFELQDGLIVKYVYDITVSMLSKPFTF